MTGCWTRSSFRTQSRAGVLRAVPSLFAGTVERVPGVTIRRVRHARVTSDHPLAMHVDGEAVECGEVLTVQITAGAPAAPIAKAKVSGKQPNPQVPQGENRRRGAFTQYLHPPRVR